MYYICVNQIRNYGPVFLRCGTSGMYKSWFLLICLGWICCVLYLYQHYNTANISVVSRHATHDAFKSLAQVRSRKTHVIMKIYFSFTLKLHIWWMVTLNKFTCPTSGLRSLCVCLFGYHHWSVRSRSQPIHPMECIPLDCNHCMNFTIFMYYWCEDEYTCVTV